MQGINLGPSKELQKHFLYHRLEEISSNHYIFQYYMSFMYMLLVSQYLLMDERQSFVFYMVIILVSMFIFKNLQHIKGKVVKNQAERSYSIQDVMTDPKAYDSLTIASVRIPSLYLWIQRALSVDFTYQFQNRFDDNRHHQTITDKTGMEVKSSINSDLTSIKTSIGSNSLLSDSQFRMGKLDSNSRSESSPSVSPQKKKPPVEVIEEVEPSMELDDMLLDNLLDIPKS